MQRKIAEQKITELPHTIYAYRHKCVYTDAVPITCNTSFFYYIPCLLCRFLRCDHAFMHLKQHQQQNPNRQSSRSGCIPGLKTLRNGVGGRKDNEKHYKHIVL